MTQSLKDAVAGFPATDPDWEIADTLNAADSTLPVKNIDVTVSDVRSILMTSGSWGGIVITASDTTQSVQIRSLCITVRDAMTNLTSLFMSDPNINASITAMMDGLLGSNLINQNTHDKLVALSKAPSSWADINNNGTAITARDVGIARGGIA